MVAASIRDRSVVWIAAAAIAGMVATLVVTWAWSVDAAPGDEESSFVPITPCRLIDTRPGPGRVGSHGSFSSDDTRTLQAHGTNGECTLPIEAVGLALNVTAVNATSRTHLRVWPDGAMPLASSLNPTPGQTAFNAVTVPLSDAGSFNIYNFQGSVNVIVDVNGYYTDSTLTDIGDRLAALEQADLALQGSVGALTASVDALEQTDLTLAESVATLGGRQARVWKSEISSEVHFDEVGGPVNSVTVTAPADGDVTIIATGTVLNNSDDIAACGIDDDNHIDTAYRVFGGVDDGYEWMEMTTMRVMSINAGQTVKYNLLCYIHEDKLPLGSTSLMAQPRMIALFTPDP